MELDLNLASSLTSCVNLSKPLHLSVPQESSSIKWVNNTYVQNWNTTLFLLKVPISRKDRLVTQLLTVVLITTNQHVVH